jgi:hypothetical protein
MSTIENMTAHQTVMLFTVFKFSCATNILDMYRAVWGEFGGLTLYTCLDIYIYIYVYIYIYMYTHIHTYIHAYIHIHARGASHSIHVLTDKRKLRLLMVSDLLCATMCPADLSEFRCSIRLD